MDNVGGFILNDRKLTALRIAYEEAGILLSSPHWKGESDDKPFYEFCIENKVTLKPQDLHFFSWHSAPPGIPNLFNVAFFFHNLQDPDIKLNINTEKFEDYEWLDPLAAMKRYDTGEWKFIPPVLYTLYELAHFDNV